MKRFFVLSSFFFYYGYAEAQSVGIGTTQPAATAILDVSSTTKGALPLPRMTSAQRLSITSPATGLMVFQTPENQTWLYNGTAWQFIPSASQQTLAVTASATITWNVNLGQLATVTLTASGKTLNIQNMLPGTTAYITVKQDGTGLRTLQLPATAKVQNGGGGNIYLSTTANATDVVSVYYDGTNYYFTIKKNFN